MTIHGTSAACMSQQHCTFFILSKASTIIIGSLLVLVVSSCTPIKVNLDETGYVIGQDNYAFAIYTGEGNLLTHPLEQFRQRQNAQPDKPFTDVYVISHGWNFTIPEAIANYHSYIEIFDQQMKRHEFGAQFRPFFIFVVWNSVTRPLTDATRAILPYQLDNSLSLLTATVDKFMFFFPSVWKQSMNAYTIALGSGFDSTRQQHSSIAGEATKCSNEDYFTTCYGVEATLMGSKYALSALLQDLFRSKARSHQPFGIHIIGHSFGGKLAALSAVDAIHRWKDESHTWVDSLLMINPAFHANELAPFEDLLGHAARNALGLTPRKGIIYSNYDYPNGLYFDISQLLLNNHSTETLQLGVHSLRDSTAKAHPIIAEIASPFLAIYYLGSGPVVSTVGWAGSKLFNMPYDFVYHVKHNDTFSVGGLAVLQALRYTFNAVHFFVPIDRLVWPGQPADRLGLFRPTKSALGRTGLNKAGNGRSTWWNVHPVEGFVDNTTDVKPDTFCALARTIYNTSSDLPVDAPVLKHTRIYSFNASTVFDGGQFSPSGSHGDVGSHDLVECDPQSTTPAIQKREYSANFIFNFTKVLPLSDETASKP